MLGTTEARLSLYTLQMRILEACQGLNFVLQERGEETETFMGRYKIVFRIAFVPRFLQTSNFAKAFMP